MYHWMSENVFREGRQNLARFVTFCRVRGDVRKVIHLRSNPPVFFIDINLIISRVSGQASWYANFCQQGLRVCCVAV